MEVSGFRQRAGRMLQPVGKVLGVTLLIYCFCAIGFAGYTTWQIESHETELESLYAGIIATSSFGIQPGDLDYMRSLPDGPIPETPRYERLLKGHEKGVFGSTVALSVHTFPEDKRATVTYLKKRLSLMIDGYTASSDPVSRRTYADLIAETYGELGNMDEESAWREIYEREESEAQNLLDIWEVAQSQQRWNLLAPFMADFHWTSRLMPQQSSD